MEPFVTHTGRALPLRRSNVDTDQIIPAVYLKRVTREGFGDGLFAAWREEPSFVLNQPRYAGATILVAGPDFGTGSSREHAVWALLDYGFRAVIAPRFGDIFRTNSTKAGLLPVVLPEKVVALIQDAAEAEPPGELTVDLDKREVRVSGGGLAEPLAEPFQIDDYTRWRLMEGLDDIGLTLRHEDAVAAFEAARPSWLPATLLSAIGSRFSVLVFADASASGSLQYERICWIAIP
jgi:3-isopropylmalate/(R)-2-methylmalate dehydratase small subunit